MRSQRCCLKLPSSSACWNSVSACTPGLCLSCWLTMLVATKQALISVMCSEVPALLLEVAFVQRLLEQRERLHARPLSQLLAHGPGAAGDKQALQSAGADQSCQACPAAQPEASLCSSSQTALRQAARLSWTLYSARLTLHE